MPKKRKHKSIPIFNAVIVSDLHCGCQLGLCPPSVELDNGTFHAHSLLQATVWQWWESFWHEWVPMATDGEPYCVVINGDIVDGRHHGTTSQISQNLADQKLIALQVLRPVRDLCDGRLYIVRGTEAHVGQSGETEEDIARELQAIPNEIGRHSRYELWLEVGGGLVHAMHHIGVTGSQAYESTALMKEYTEICSDAARWGRPAPDVVVRSHRHRQCEVRVPTQSGYGIAFCSAAWQLKSPFAYKVPGGRVTTPQIGGSLVRCSAQDFFTRHKVWNIERSKVEVAGNEKDRTDDHGRAVARRVG